MADQDQGQAQPPSSRSERENSELSMTGRPPEGSGFVGFQPSQSRSEGTTPLTALAREIAERNTGRPAYLANDEEWAEALGEAEATFGPPKALSPLADAVRRAQGHHTGEEVVEQIKAFNRGKLEHYEDAHGVPRTPDLSIREHVALAERHAQRALDLAYGDEPQGRRVRLALGKAQSVLISLIANERLR